MLQAGYTSVPEIKTPKSTIVIITLLTLGLGYIWYQHRKSIKDNEKSSTIRTG